MTPISRQLMPWCAGVAIIFLAVIFIGYQVLWAGCSAPTLYTVAVLVVVPLVYLALMYLTFISR